MLTQCYHRHACYNWRLSSAFADDHRNLYGWRATIAAALAWAASGFNDAQTVYTQLPFAMSARASKRWFKTLLNGPELDQLSRQGTLDPYSGGAVSHATVSSSVQVCSSDNSA
jgi:TRAP-type mannitol/chloroaromatic compound transport system substrate-binding protein